MRFIHWFWALKWRYKGTAIGVAAFLILSIIVGATSSGDEDSGASAADAEASEVATATAETSSPTATATATNTPSPTATPTPTATPVPPTPTPTDVPPPPPLSGVGQTATEPVALTPGLWIISLTHSGSRNFIVRAVSTAGDEMSLTNEIGPYSGERWLAGATYLFDVQADGAWTIAFTPMPPDLGAADALAGTGDDVSGVFLPLAGNAQPWDFTHSGRRNFIVWLYCDEGNDLVQNEIGPVSGSRVVSFPVGAGLCFWDVQADGDWTMTRRQ
jgi:hypothetical protein